MNQCKARYLASLLATMAGGVLLGCSAGRSVENPTEPEHESELRLTASEDGLDQAQSKPEEEVFGSVFISGRLLNLSDPVYYLELTLLEDPGSNNSGFEGPQVVYVDPVITAGNQWGWYGKDVHGQNMNRGLCGGGEDDVEVHRVFQSGDWIDPPLGPEKHCIGPGRFRIRLYRDLSGTSDALMASREIDFVAEDEIRSTNMLSFEDPDWGEQWVDNIVHLELGGFFTITPLISVTQATSATGAIVYNFDTSGTTTSWNRALGGEISVRWQYDTERLDTLRGWG